MEKNLKRILLIDLCGRSPYGVKVHADIDGDNTLLGVYGNRVFTTCEEPDKHNDYPVECIKPYLRPMSNITEEERKELSNYENSVQRTDFFYSHHIDCRFMIEKGLALEAPDGMYKID